MTISDICRQLDAWGFRHRLKGNGAMEIVGFSDPKDYVPRTMIWIGKLEDIDTDKTAFSEIALVFSKENEAVEEALPNVIFLDDPKSAFMNLVYREHAPEKKDYRDPTAQIAESAVIGKNCWIGRNVVIEDGAVIGDGCEIRENTYIGKNCVLGRDCAVGQNVIIGGETNGSAFYDTEGVMRNMPNIGRVVIGNCVLIGAGSLIARGTFTETVIGDECELNAGTSIGHNCRIRNNVQLLGRCTLSGNSTIGAYSQLISACVKNRIVIGSHVKVGIGSVVLKDIPDGKTCFGNPARVMPG